MLVKAAKEVSLDNGPVYIVEDDREVRSSLVLLLRSLKAEARPFISAEDFLDELAFLQPGIVLLDLRMPGMSGIELLEAMRERHCFWPAVMMSGHGDISVAVQAIKLGALEFLQKPFEEEDLLAALTESSRQLPSAVAKSRRVKARASMISSLSPREREVLNGVVTGKTSKAIAADLSLSPRTVESYRVTMMAKMGARNLHDLLAMVPATEARK